MKNLNFGELYTNYLLKSIVLMSFIHLFNKCEELQSSGPNLGIFSQRWTLSTFSSLAMHPLLPVSPRSHCPLIICSPIPTHHTEHSVQQNHQHLRPQIFFFCLLGSGKTFPLEIFTILLQKMSKVFLSPLPQAWVMQ